MESYYLERNIAFMTLWKVYVKHHKDQFYMFVFNFQGSEISLNFQHGMRDFIFNGKALRMEQVTIVAIIIGDHTEWSAINGYNTTSDF